MSLSLSDESGTSRIGIDAPVVRGKIIKGQKRSFLLARTTSSLGRVGSLIDGSLPTGDSLGQIWHISASDGNLGGDPFGEVSHRLYRSYQGRDLIIPVFFTLMLLNPIVMRIFGSPGRMI